MSIISIFLIAVALSMDAAAVAAAIGLSAKKITWGNTLKPALAFGIFQGVMPLIGWSAGKFLDQYIKTFDHWIAFILLAIIGIRMIIEAFEKKSEKDKASNLTNLKILFLAIATSIDALAVGLSFAFLKSDILIPAIIITITTFVLSLIASILGNKIGKLFEKKIQIIGGLILIGIGIKILIEHLLTNL